MFPFERALDVIHCGLHCVITFFEAYLLLVLNRVLQHDLKQLLDVPKENFRRGESDGRRWPWKVALMKI